VRVDVSSFFWVDRLADAVRVLTNKAGVPVPCPLKLVLTDLFSSLLVTEHLLFGALVFLD